MRSPIRGHYRARTLRLEAEQARQHFLPQLLLEPQALNQPDQLFAAPKNKLCLEVGFGAGEYLLAQLQQNPETGFIGCEPYKNGMAKFLLELAPTLPPPANVRLYDGNGEDLLPHLPPTSLDQLVLLYPDPWKKTRHAKHRFIQKNTLSLLAAALKPQGEIFFATDDSQLAAWVLSHFIADGRFHWHKENAQHAVPPYLTRYEAKANEKILSQAQKKHPLRLVFSKK